jgi:hypothetical protein
MTKISERKTRLSFETDAEMRGWGSKTIDKKTRRVPVTRAIIVDVDNGWHGTVRLKGTRQTFDFSWEGLFLWAVEQRVMKERAEKKRLRDAKKKGRLVHVHQTA